MGITAICFGYETVNCEAVAKNSHATFGDASMRGQFRSSARALTESVEDAEIDTRFQCGAALMRGDCLPNERGIRFRHSGEDISFVRPQLRSALVDERSAERQLRVSIAV